MSTHQTLLYQVVAREWPSFCERAEFVGGLPKFIVDEFEAYLRCGILEHGLAHLACGRCGESMVVGFSCKRRAYGWQWLDLEIPASGEVVDAGVRARSAPGSAPTSASSMVRPEPR